MAVYEYTRHLFVAKNLPMCANYALHKLAKDNAVSDECLVRTVQRSFYKLTKWIKNDDVVRSQIPETDSSTNAVKIFEAEAQPSSILGINLKLDIDSRVICCGTEQEIAALIALRIVL